MTVGPNVQSTAASPGDITRRELYFFNLYRCLEAVVYAGLVFSPFAVEWVRVTRPMLGQVAAGAPIGADIGSDQTLILDRVLFSPAPDYLLKVKGDSMRDEGIFDGDLIGVHRTPTARSGQIVVARLDDEIKVKLLKTGGDRVRLLPRNPDYAPIEVQPGQDFAIEGLNCGLVRPNR